MLTKHFQRQFAYNEWAWQQVFASVKALSAEIYHADQGYFWGSMHGMLVHGLSAEFIWLERFNGRSPNALLTPDDLNDAAANLVRWRAVEPDVAPRAALFAKWEGVSAEWRERIDTMTEDDWSQPISYRSTEGRAHVQPMMTIAQHVLMHGMEHRSQLTPMLFNLGVPTTQLDFIYYCLSNQE